jgi:pimeloyl-ACP methyl ester carboxylesterase
MKPLVLSLLIMMAIQERHAELPGVRLFYRDSGGSGVPVVFLHAATGNSGAWGHQEPAFVAAGYRFIAYDRRGFGRTVVEPNAPAATGADDLQALVDFLRIDRFHLVATAAGGFVALDYAVSFPQRLRSLVVANSIGGIQDEDYLALGRRLRPPEFNALPADVRELGPAYRAGSPAGTERWKALERASRPSGGPAPAQPMRNRLTFALLKTIELPTLMLTGGADLYAPPPVMKMFADRIRGAEFIVIPDVGHSAYWEAPDEFNRTLLAFFKRH